MCGLSLEAVSAAFAAGSLNYNATGYTSFALGPRFGRSMVTTKIGIEPTELDISILAGADDLVTPPADAEIIKAGIKGARLEVITDSAHNLTTERPTEVNAAVEKFLASLS